jgi:hypothetical protein
MRIFGEGFFIIKGKIQWVNKYNRIYSMGLLGEHLMAKKMKIYNKTGESKCEVAITFEISDILYRV